MAVGNGVGVITVAVGMTTVASGAGATGMLDREQEIRKKPSSGA